MIDLKQPARSWSPMARPILAIFACMAAAAATVAAAAPSAASAPWDPRIRVVAYDADSIYSLRGFAGLEIDVQFSASERVTGVAIGDARAVTVATVGNQLFLKPRAVPVATNLTVLTGRRTYLFQYTATAGPPPQGSALYVLRFEYPPAEVRARVYSGERISRDLAAAEQAAPRNYDYWYCGAPSLKPIAAWDDGTETHLVFGARAELPAVFALNDDGSESLVNTHMSGPEMIIERIARRLIVRRGKLSGCIVNRAYSGVGRRLASGTIAPDVLRLTRRPPGSAARSSAPMYGARP